MEQLFEPPLTLPPGAKWDNHFSQFFHSPAASVVFITLERAVLAKIDGQEMHMLSVYSHFNLSNQSRIYLGESSANHPRIYILLSVLSFFCPFNMFTSLCTIMLV
jgi:hypothetical protein